jgi:hypothetical protein
VEDPVRILGLWKIQWSQFAPKIPKRQAELAHFTSAAPAETGVLGERHDRVSVLADPGGGFHIQTCGLSDVIGNSLASLGRALRVLRTAVRRDHFRLHAC